MFPLIDQSSDFTPYNYLLYMTPILLDAHMVVETGLGSGGSACTFLMALSQLPNPETRKLVTYENNMDEKFVRPKTETAQIIRDRKYAAQWDLRIRDSGDPQWTGEQIDFLFLDSDHSYEHVKRELEVFMPFMARRFVIMSDDTVDPANRAEPFGPELAFREKGGLHFYFTDMKGLSVLVKP